MLPCGTQHPSGGEGCLGTIRHYLRPAGPPVTRISDTRFSETFLPRARASWLPAEGTVDLVATGRWWDVVAISGILGMAAGDEIQAVRKGHTGPILHEPRGPQLITYFLTHLGTARRWNAPDSEAYGEACYLLVPGDLLPDPETVHWVAPPRVSGSLISPVDLHASLRKAHAHRGST